MADSVVAPSECKERVAFDLMRLVHNHGVATDGEKQTRDYWYKLYAECYALVVRGVGPEHAKKVV